MTRLMLHLVVLALAFFSATAFAQPSCPQVANFQFTPDSPGPSDSIVVRLVLSGASATDWALVAQSENEIRLDVVIGWQGGIGPPQLWTPLGSLPAGEYQIIVSPTILNIPEPCPPVSLSLTVGGPLGAAPVPAPMFSPPVLLVLIALLGGIGWRAMRRRGVQA